MPKAKLTDRYIVAELEPAQREYIVYDTATTGFCLVVRPSGVMTYQYRYRNAAGRKRTFTLGKRGERNITATTAREAAEKAAAQVTLGVDIAEEKRTRKVEDEHKRAQAKADAAKELGTFIRDYWEPWAEANLTDWQGAKRILDVDFAKYHSYNLDALTQWEIKKWQAATKKRKHPLSAATINRRVGVLKSLLGRAVEWGVIAESPLAGMRKLKVDTKAVVRHLSKSEEAALRKALQGRSERQRAERERYIEWRESRGLEAPQALSGRFTDHLEPLVLVALNTGMRRGELFNLEWRDVQLKDKKRPHVTVRGEVSRKSGQTRHIPLNSEVAQVLAAWADQSGRHGLVFTSPSTGGRFEDIKTAWGKLISDSGVKDFRFHDLRHTFASNLVMRGVDLYTVSQLMGHSDMDMTKRYAHLSDEHKAAAVALL